MSCDNAELKYDDVTGPGRLNEAPERPNRSSCHSRRRQAYTVTPRISKPLGRT
ncbi:MAG: hypothetical protein ACLRMJ_05685 [Alistipes finegoldii]